MNKKTLQSCLYYSVSIIAVFGFSYYFYINKDKFISLMNFSFIDVALIFLISISFSVINGIQNVLLYQIMGVRVTYWDGILITAASTLANQLPISGGIVSRGVYLKRKFGLSYSFFASSVVASFFLYISISGIIGLIILGFWGISDVTENPPFVLLIGYSVMVLSSLLLFLPLDRVWLPKRFRNRVIMATEGWDVVRKKPLELAKISILQILLMVLLAWRYWIAFHLLSQDVTIPQTLLFSTASILTQLVSIAPGGLGVREAIVGAVAATLGFDPGIGVLAIGLDRIVSTTIIFLFGWISVVILGKQFADETVGRNKSYM